MRPFLLALVLLCLPFAGPASAAPEECVNVAVDHVGGGPAVFASVFGVTGVGGSIPANPATPNGLSFAVYVAQAQCRLACPVPHELVCKTYDSLMHVGGSGGLP